MYDYQIAVLKMIDEIIRFYENNPDLIKGDPILKKHYEELVALRADVLENKKIQEADIKGVFAKKKKEKSQLSEDIFQITGSLRSYATDTSNDLLYKEIDESKSGINKKADEDVISYCSLVIDRLTKYQEELKPYGIKAEDLVNLTKQNKDYRNLMLLPAKMRKDVKTATNNLKSILTKIKHLLSESLDNDMLRYQDSQPKLYKEYAVLREIDDSQTTALSFKGTVTDAHEPAHVLQYAKVTAKFKAGSALKEIHAVSSKKGNYQFKGIPEGECTLTFTLEKYDSFVVESVVRPDKLTRVDVKMKKTIK